MKYARSNLCVTSHEGKLWVIGGIDSYGDEILNIEVYDPLIDSWSDAQVQLETTGNSGEVCGCNFITEYFSAS